jgi:antirestriction protein ArdC
MTHYGIDTISKKEAEHLGIINSDGLGFIKPQTAFKNITEELVSKIKKGDLVWRQGWRSGVVVKGKTYGAQNYETQRPYTGGNAFFLAMQNLINGTNYNFFLTPKQIASRGATIKKGSKPFPVFVFIKNLKTEIVVRRGEQTEVTTEEKGIIWYYVYPIDVCEGLEPIVRKTLKPDTFNEIVVTDAETIIANMPKAPQIKHGGDKAYWTPDYVQMPNKKAFTVQQEYYSVLFHELTHATGYKTRLNRDMTGKFGSKPYALEELIAELSAAYLCGVCEIDFYTVNNSAAYLKSWSKRLLTEIEADPNFLKRAVFKAARAANFIIGKTLEKHGVVVKDVSKEKEIEKINPLLYDYPKGLQKFIDIAYNNSFEDSITKITKIKGVEQDVRTYFSKHYNPDSKLSVSDSFVKFYDDVQEVKSKKNTLKTGKITPDKSVEASVGKAIKDLLSLPKYSKYSGFAISIFYNVFKKTSSVENLRNKIAAKLFEEKLNHFFEEIEVDYTEKIKKATLNEAGKELISKIESRLQTLKAKKSGTDLFPELAGVTDAVLIFINAFLSTHDKTVSKEELIYIITTFQLAIKKGLVKAKHPLAAIANTTQTKLLNVINKLDAKQKIKIKISNKKEIENKILGLNGLGFWNVIASAVIGKSAEYFANKALTKTKPTNLSGVMTVTDAINGKYDLIGLDGNYLKLIGEACKPTSFFIYGPGGSGKSTFTLLFSDYMAKKGNKMLYVAGEQFGTPVFSKMLKRLEIEDSKNFVIVKSIQTLPLKGFDFIVIDSKDSLNFELNDFIALKKNNPNLSFVILSQATKDGGFTGSEKWRNEVDTLLYCENLIVHSNLDKNRWGGSAQFSILKMK